MVNYRVERYFGEYDWGENPEVLDGKKIIANISLSRQFNRNGGGYYKAADYYFLPSKH
jgi:hypothetical protein